jgi:protein-S-isoprenylcysteine O-methyltransferase Ste14
VDKSKDAFCGWKVPHHLRGRMALIEEFDKSGNWLFRWRSFLPLVLYVLAAAVIFSEADVHIPTFEMRWAITCIGIALFGQLIRAITIGYTPKGTSGRNTKEGQVAEVLNTKGIYSIVRHPLYLGNYFMWLGIIIYVGNWWFTIVCSLMFWLYYERIMFAEEYFLRKKFGQTYLDWAANVPSFWPRWMQWKSSGVEFSFRNVLKREYNGFFAIFISFLLLDVMKNFVHFGFSNIQELVTPFWLYATIIAFFVFIVLRSLKKYTKVLNVEGREFFGTK